MADVTFENVSFIYNKGTAYEVKALDDVSLTFPDHCITGLIGHTGSGKSTMMQLINGLKKPTSGVVKIDGTDIWAEPKKIRDVRFRAGLVMQYPEYQLFAETVEEDIAFGPKNMGLTGDALAERIEYAIRFADVDPALLKKSPFDLSGGQKRRVALAGVIAMRPEILILDEPAAGLDPGGRREILGGVKRYARESGTNVIIVSHSMEDMAMYCDALVVMTAGRVFLHDRLGPVFSRAADLIAVGLDVPQITRVAFALRERGVDIGSDVYTVAWAAEQLAALADRNGEQTRR